MCSITLPDQSPKQIVVLLNRPENVQAGLSVCNVHEERRWLIRVATLQKEWLRGDEDGIR